MLCRRHKAAASKFTGAVAGSTNLGAQRAVPLDTGLLADSVARVIRTGYGTAPSKSSAKDQGYDGCRTAASRQRE